MGGLQLMDGSQMSELHRSLLNTSRVYLLQNIQPTESLWAHFISKDVLSHDMVDEIKARTTTRQKIGMLLDYLPTRGPEAFDLFCDTLLECDHSHVAEYLKINEATDKFRAEIGPHCPDLPQHRMENFVSIFKKNTPMLRHFAQRQFELIMQEQDEDLQQSRCRAEMQKLKGKNEMLQLELIQLRSFLNTCYETSENISIEVQRDFITRSFISEENEHLEKLKISLKDLTGFEKITGFYENTQQLLKFLEKHVGVKVKDPSAEGGSGSKNQDTSARTMSSFGRTIHEKLQRMANQITQLSDNLGAKVQVPGHEVREGLGHVLQTFEEISQDVFKIRDTLKHTQHEKRKLERKVLSLQHCLEGWDEEQKHYSNIRKEIKRWKREEKENQSHIVELNKQAQLLKKKTKQKKQLQQVNQDIERKKAKVQEIQWLLQRMNESVDQKMAGMLALLPDVDDPAYNPSDTELTPSEVSSLPGSYCRSRAASLLGPRPNTGILADQVPPEEKLHEKLTSDDDEVAEAKNTGQSETFNAKAKPISITKNKACNDQGASTTRTETSRHSIVENSHPLLVKRQKQLVPFRVSTLKASTKIDQKQEDKQKPKGLMTTNGAKIDEWLKQQEQLQKQDEKFTEQQTRTRKGNADNAQGKRLENENKKPSVKKGNEVNKKVTHEDINANDVKDNPCQKSTKASEKEKHRLEANKGSPTSRFTGSETPFVTRVTSHDLDLGEDPHPVNDATKDPKDTTTKDSKDMQVSFKNLQYPEHHKKHKQQPHADERRYHPSKHIHSQTTDGADFTGVIGKKMGY